MPPSPQRSRRRPPDAQVEQRRRDGNSLPQIYPPSRRLERGVLGRCRNLYAVYRATDRFPARGTRVRFRRHGQRPAGSGSCE